MCVCEISQIRNDKKPACSLLHDSDLRKLKYCSDFAQHYKFKIKQNTPKPRHAQQDMRAIFFLTTASALTAQALLALELGTPSALTTSDSSHTVDALSLAETNSHVSAAEPINT